MNENLNTVMAIEVMGYMERFIEAYYPDGSGEWLYYDKYELPVGKKDAWHPDTDLNQAMMCAFKSGASKVSITEVDIDRYMASIYPDCFSDNNKPICKVSDIASLAICEAIRESVGGK